MPTPSVRRFRDRSGRGAPSRDDGASGTKLLSIEVGPAVSGPSVSGGQVFVGTGDFTGLSGNYAPGGSITALGLP